MSAKTTSAKTTSARHVSLIPEGSNQTLSAKISQGYPVLLELKIDAHSIKMTVSEFRDFVKSCDLPEEPQYDPYR